MHDLEDYNRPSRSVITELRERLCKSWKWLKNRVAHKLSHLKPSYLLDILGRHGLSLVVIIVGWEIIEDVVFPVLFIWLGNNVHPAFLVGAPVSWIICLHWLVVPLTWSFWMKIKNKKK